MSTGGLIGVFARHPTAANLLMVIMIISGFFALNKMNTQFFPDFGIDIVSVSVEWPGASAEDVDSNIVQAIEPEVRFLDSVKRVRSSSLEGRATILVEFNAGTDMQSALSDVETAVSTVTTLPDDSEQPEVRKIVRYDSISRLVLSGPVPESSLKQVAKRIRDGLLDRGIDQVDLFGARDEEIWVEIAPETLLELDLTLQNISDRIRETSQDVPSGDTSGAMEMQIRSLGLLKTAEGMGGVEVRALQNGQKIYLRDIASISENFDEGGKEARRNGYPAIEIYVQRAVNADALELAVTASDYIDEIRPTLPPSIKLEQYDIQARLIKSRIDLLLKNGFSGLILVIIVLFVFLNAPVAFWVAAGIPVALMATMLFMLMSGQTINMLSLFGIIMALGIVVDDAIVVGEHAETKSREGLSSIDAAIEGARRMAAPVLSASLTTIAAFTPLLIISDIIGQIIRGIPFVIIAVIVASLFECFFVLPGHMRGALKQRKKAGKWALRVKFDNGFNRFKEGMFRPLVTHAVASRYSTLAIAVAALILSVGLMIGGRVGFVFFPSPEADKVFANVQMVAGTPKAQTIAMLSELERSLLASAKRLNGGEDGLVRMSLLKLGSEVGRPSAAPVSGDHIGGVTVELQASDERDVRTDALMDAWRAEVRPVAGMDTLTILPAQGGPPGRDVDVRLSGKDITALKTASLEVQTLLKRYPGVSSIEDDLPYGKLEAIIEVTPDGRAMGFTTQSVGRQVRSAFEGAIAKRFPRGDEEVTVRVQFPRDVIGPGALGELHLRGNAGAEVALSEIVSTRETRGFSRIRREDGIRQVAVTAELDKGVTSTGKILDALAEDGIKEIVRKHGLRVKYAGKAEEQATTLADMKLGAMIGLSAIYIILAWVFASYTRPIVVMSIIPLGFVGAAFGHYLLGFDLTILSMIALIGLSGIVVNDSIILVSTIDERLAGGEARTKAIIDGACDRLRAVILTSATTIGGLLPLMFERSLQAQFLIPMALTMIFGLLFTTLLVLFVVPALIAVQDDLGNLKNRLWRFYVTSSAE
jgi:multidrug efflux pump subunit AcrB